MGGLYRPGHQHSNEVRAAHPLQTSGGLGKTRAAILNAQFMLLALDWPYDRYGATTSSKG